MNLPCLIQMKRWSVLVGRPVSALKRNVGGLLSYGIDLVDLFRRLAVLTNEVLRGAKPGDIPYYQMTKFDLVLNRATARSLGLDFPPILLATANDVIE